MSFRSSRQFAFLVLISFALDSIGLAQERRVEQVDERAVVQPEAVVDARPLGLRGTLQPLDAVDTFAAPILDRGAIAIDDANRMLEGKPPRYAIPNQTHITPDTHGTWEQPDPATLVWRLRVRSPDATSINFGFTRFLMPGGGRLTVYSADGSHLFRPFTDLDNEAHGELWTPPVRSDDVLVEVSIPAASREQLRLVLGSVNIGYREFGKPAEQTVALSGSCNVDVVCPQGDPWRDEIASVGVISTGGSTFCTGAMVNNTAQDLKPYFLTANHCGIGAGNAASLVVFWNYQNSTCRPVGSPASGGPGDGQLNQFQTGSFFRAASSASDFTLVELDEDPNPAWMVSFAGWSRSSGESPSGVCIHHPNTDEKRITFYSLPTTTTSYNNPAVPGDGTHVRARWSLGVTEPGSSGSPLFDADHRVIGQLHGGPSACGASDLSDYYGRVSRSWTGGGTNSTRLSNWLDPSNTGAMFVDTISGGGLNVTPGENVLHIGVAGGPFTNPVVNYTLSNPSNQPVDYRVSLSASFGILLDGGTADLNGTLAANGGSTQVQVSLGPAVASLAAGVYVESVLFEDLTNALSTSRQHTVEIGQTLFSVTPSTNLESGGPVGGPFPGSIVYTVTSQRPTPLTVKVTADAPWISLNGATGPLTINLVGTGDSQMLTVSFSAAAGSLAAGIYNGSVLFENQSGGPGNTSRSVTLDVGRIVYSSSDTPRPIADNATVTSQIVVAEDFCIGDVNVDVNISHTYIGDLIVELVSPSGTIVRLHNRGGGTTDDIVATYDDEGTLPSGPGALSDFDSESSAGIWRLVVSDNASQDTGTLNSWALRIAPVSGACPTPSLLHSFPLNSSPGWALQGQWQFGQPLGGGSGNRDPSSGFTGTNVYGYNLAGDYPNNMGSTLYLTTTAIDCSTIAGTRLRFQRRLGVESATYDQANVQVSNNGTTWTNVWQHSGSTLNESAWTLQSLDISAVADGQPTVFVRWGMGPTDGSVTYFGWNIDDIEIWGIATLVDCNGNLVPDAEDIAGGFSEDCNGNEIPDECDLGSISRDCNADLVPDECQLAAPSAEAAPIAKSRFISLVPTDGSSPTAIRVILTSLNDPQPPYSGGPSPDFSAFEGQVRWVGPPVEYIESQANPTVFLAATLQCQPYYSDWSTVGLLHVTGDAVVPSSIYDIQAVPAGCNTSDEANYSAALRVNTSRWGDVETPFNPPSASTQPDIADVAAMVNKFKSVSGAPIKARVLLTGPVPNAGPDIGFDQIASCVDAFKGGGYPHPIATCP